MQELKLTNYTQEIVKICKKRRLKVYKPRSISTMLTKKGYKITTTNAHIFKIYNELCQQYKEVGNKRIVTND